MAMSNFAWVYPTRYLAWEAADNCKNATYPLKIYRFVPAEIISVESAILQFSIENFRSFETASVANSAPGASYSLVDLTTHNFAEANVWEDTTITLVVSSTTFSVKAGFCFGPTDLGQNDEIFFRVKNTTDTIYYPSEDGINFFFSEIAFPLYDNTFFFVEIPGNLNGKTLVLQTKSEDTADASMILTGAWHLTGTHTHAMTYDIYESTPTNPSVSIKINDTDRTTALGGPWTSDQDGIDIAEYLNIGEWNKIELVPNQLLRLNASVLATAVV